MFKDKITLKTKTQITDKIWEYNFFTPRKIDFKAGQFANIIVKGNIRRSYSILDGDASSIKFLVDLSPGGPGSQFFERVDVGDNTEAIAPLGRFLCRENSRNKVFVATGTGLAPFYKMVKDLLYSEFKKEIKVYLGSRYETEANSLNYFNEFASFPNFKLAHCISQPTSQNSSSQKGRVTNVMGKMLKNNEIAITDTEFYLCGVNQMIDDMVQLLQDNGVKTENILTEKYG